MKTLHESNCLAMLRMGLKTSEICKEIREAFNNSTIKRTLVFQNRRNGDWAQFCVALDTIGSTCLAIEKFQNDLRDSLVGNEYLLICGILQILVIQQDAVSFLKTSLFGGKGIDWRDEKHFSISEIRKVRNETIGHPVRMGNIQKNAQYEKDELTFCSIDWSSITKDGFSYFLWMSSKMEERSVNFSKVIQQQDQMLSADLREIMEKMQNEESEHKAKFKDKSLADLLGSPTMLEDVSFIHAAAWGDRLAWQCFSRYAAAFKDVREGLEARYWTIDETLRIPGTILVIDKLNFIFSKIKSFQEADEFDRYEFEIYIDSLSVGIEELRWQLRSIDKEFNA